MPENSHSVLVYSASWCAFCHAVKQYLTNIKVPYREIEVDKDQQAAQELVSKTGMSAVPVVQIGSEIIVGFDRERIDSALRANKLV